MVDLSYFNNLGSSSVVVWNAPGVFEVSTDPRSAYGMYPEPWAGMDSQSSSAIYPTMWSSSETMPPPQSYMQTTTIYPDTLTEIGKAPSPRVRSGSHSDSGARVSPNSPSSPVVRKNKAEWTKLKDDIRSAVSDVVGKCANYIIYRAATNDFKALGDSGKLTMDTVAQWRAAKGLTREARGLLDIAERNRRNNPSLPTPEALRRFGSGRSMDLSTLPSELRAEIAIAQGAVNKCVRAVSQYNAFEKAVKDYQSLSGSSRKAGKFANNVMRRLGLV